MYFLEVRRERASNLCARDDKLAVCGVLLHMKREEDEDERAGLGVSGKGNGYQYREEED